MNLKCNVFNYKYYIHIYIYTYRHVCIQRWGFHGGSAIKSLPANAGDARDVDSIPVWERSPREGMAAHSCILDWRTPWTEEADGPWSIRLTHVRQG